MTKENLTPVFKTKEALAPLGRGADVLAAGLAGLGAVLAIAGALWFFLGFAENDSRPEHLTSAFALTLILFAFAIVPFTCVTQFARRAYRKGTNRPHLLWTLFLMLPWVGLGMLSVSHTPLPVWCGVSITTLATLLTLWALVSLILDWKTVSANTDSSQQNEMQNTPE